MTRSEHLQWCKDRALAYLPHAPQNAIESMLSDLGKHDGTKNHCGIELGMMLIMGGHLVAGLEARRFIEGFN